MAIQSFSHQNIVIGTEFMLDVSITGSPQRVWVEGDLEGFNYKWTGTHVEIRGTATRLITNAEFTIHAGTESRTGTYSVVTAAPVITTPGPQTLYKENNTKIEITITNNVDRLIAEGEWIGLKLKRGGNGAIIEGVIPNQEYSIDNGTMHLIAINGGGRDNVDIPWQFGTPQAPSWRTIPDPYEYEISDTFRLDLDSYVSGTPTPDISLVSGTIPTGLTFDAETHLLSGNFTQAGKYSPMFRASNVGGSANSKEINIVVVDAFAAPAYLGNVPSTWYVRSTDATFDISQYFNEGAPEGTYNVSVYEYSPSQGYFSVHINTNTGVLRVTDITDGERMYAQVTVTNSQGTARSNYFDIVIDLP